MKNDIYNWEEELGELTLSDKRLKERLFKMLDSFATSPSQSIFLATGGRSEAKAAYRFLVNERVDRDALLEGIAKATAQKISTMNEATILCIQDTTSLGFGMRKGIDGMGYYCAATGKGMNVHTSIAVTEEGLPLGILHQEYHTREFLSDKTQTKDQKKNRPIEEKESFYWLNTIEHTCKYIPPKVTCIHICDREGDFYELFDYAQKEEEIFLVRMAQNRPDKDNRKVMDELKKAKPKGELMIKAGRNPSECIPSRMVKMNIAYETFQIKKPRRRVEKHLLKTIEVTGIYVYETGVPEEKALSWFLLTNALVKKPEDVVRMINHYTQRWKIERFHYVLKSGCAIEKKQVRSFDKMSLLTLLYSAIAMKILSLTYLGRLFPQFPCNVLLEEEEWKILYQVSNKTKNFPQKPYNLEEAIRYIGLLGGFNGAPSDGPPGVKVLWRGLEKLLFILECRDYMI